MLQFIRERAQTWIAWVIVTFIIVVFALWGISNYFSGEKTDDVAKVDGEPITERQLQRQVLQQQQRLRQALGDAYSPELFPEGQMRRQALQGMIEKALLVQTAQKRGLHISEAQLAAFILNTPAFQEGGQFSQTRYERLLRNQGLSPQGFEFEMRRDLLTQQLYAGVARSDFATSHEYQAALRLHAQEREVGYLRFPLERFRTETAPTEEEIARFYEENEQLFRIPERVRVAYLDLSLPQLMERVEVDDEAIRKRYEAQLANYREPEERRARHILIEVPAGADAEQVEEARAEAQRLYEALQGGADFAALAREHSDDPGSATEGGDLGFFGAGIMDPEFETAAFSLEKGEVSEPVRTAFGYHLIRVEAIRGGETRPLEAVREEIRADIQRERAENRFYEQAETLANLAYEYPQTLEPAAELLELPIQKSPLFSRNGVDEGLFANAKLLSTAFSEDVLKERYNSEPIEVETNRLVVLRLLEHQPAGRQPLAEVTDEIRERLRHRQAAAAARAAAEEAVRRLRGTPAAEPSELAASMEAEWRPVQRITRQTESMKEAVVQTAFALPHPADRPLVKRIELPDDEPLVVFLQSVSSGDTEAVDPSGTLAGEMARANGDAAFTAFLETLQAAAQIEMADKMQAQ